MSSQLPHPSFAHGRGSHNGNNSRSISDPQAESSKARANITMPTQDPHSSEAHGPGFYKRNDYRAVSDPQASSSNKGKGVAQPSTELRCVKHLTCYYWYTNGICNKADDECAYSHENTGRLAEKPQIVSRGEKAKAGKSLRRALEKNRRSDPTPTLPSKDGFGCSKQPASPKAASPPRVFPSPIVTNSTDSFASGSSSVANGSPKAGKAPSSDKVESMLSDSLDLESRLRIAQKLVSDLKADNKIQRGIIETLEAALQSKNYPDECKIASLEAELATAKERKWSCNCTTELPPAPLVNPWGVIGGPVTQNEGVAWNNANNTQLREGSLQRYNGDGVALLPRGLFEIPRDRFGVGDWEDDWDFLPMALRTR